MDFKNPLTCTFDLGPAYESPITSRRIHNYYKSARRGRPVNASATPVLNPSPTQFKGHVLVIDDDAFSRTLIGAPLIEMGYKVSFADNYASGIEALLQRKYDLVVLDWLLADATGFDVLLKVEQLLKKDKEASITKVVTYSNCSIHQLRMPELARFSYEGHWLKPFNKTQLKKTLTAL